MRARPQILAEIGELRRNVEDDLYACQKVRVVVVCVRACVRACVEGGGRGEGVDRRLGRGSHRVGHSQGESVFWENK